MTYAIYAPWNNNLSAIVNVPYGKVVTNTNRTVLCKNTACYLSFGVRKCAVHLYWLRHSLANMSFGCHGNVMSFDTLKCLQHI